MESIVTTKVEAHPDWDTQTVVCNHGSTFLTLESSDQRYALMGTADELNSFAESIKNAVKLGIMEVTEQ